MGLRSAALVAALPWAAAASYETKWYTQSLTHAKGDDRTYQQRYLVNDTFWGKGSAPLWRCLLYTSPSPRDKRQSRMPSSA